VLATSCEEQDTVIPMKVTCIPEMADAFNSYFVDRNVASFITFYQRYFNILMICKMVVYHFAILITLVFQFVCFMFYRVL
jgi:hypothetical protein